MVRYLGRLTAKHALAALVAVATVALALFDGGYDESTFATGSVFVWLAVLVGLAAGVLPREEPPRTAIAAGACLAGLAAVTALSLTWGSDDGRAYADAVRVLGYLGLFTLVVVASRPGQATPWLRGLAIGLLAVGALALLSRLEPSLLGEGDMQLASDLPAAAGRLSYPVGYWNGLAAAMAICVVLLVWVGTRAETRLGRALAIAAVPVPALVLYASTSRGGAIAAVLGLATLIAAGPLRGRLAAGFAIGAAAAAGLIAFAASRDELLDRPGTELAAAQGDEVLIATVVAAAIAGAALYLADPALARIRVSPRVRVAVLTALGVAALAAIVAADPAQRFEEFKQPPTAADLEGERDLLARGGSSGRYQFWQAAVDAFESKPVAGIGAAGYEAWWAQNGSIPSPTRNAHSLFLDTLAELGLVGLLLVLGFFACVAVAAAARLRGRLSETAAAPPAARAPGSDPGAGYVGASGAALAALAAGLVGAAIDWTWDLPAVFGPAIVAAALLAGPATQVRVPRPPAVDRPVGVARTRRRFAGGVAVLLLAWVAVCASGLLVLGDLALRSSRDAAGRGDLDAAAARAEDAIDLEPWAAEPRTQLALVYEAAGDGERARATLAEAIERAPEDWRLWVLSARFELAAGELAQAREAFRRARELNRFDAGLRQPLRDYLAQN